MADLLYLDCSTGVSGDMLLSALAHCLEERGEPGFETLQTLPARLGLSGVRVEITDKPVCSIRTFHLEVLEAEKQPLRLLADIEVILAAADLDDTVRCAARSCVRMLAEAEAKVHSTTPDKIHFHEVGGVDTVVDIVGAMELVALAKAEKIVSSPVDLGSGFVTMAHGRLPVPPPACAELCKGLTVFGSDCGMERATPTGLTILRSIADHCGPMPMGRVVAVGYGSGGRSSDAQPTYVRAFAMESETVELPEREIGPGGSGSDHAPGCGCRRA